MRFSFEICVFTFEFIMDTVNKKTDINTDTSVKEGNLSEHKPRQKNVFGRRARFPRKGAGRAFDKRERPEFAQKVIDVRRVARVVAGGRRFSFSVAIILGDKEGRVGVGLGKAQDTSLAIDKATREAKKNMIKVPLTDTRSIPHEVEAKYASTRVRIIPVPGKGLVAGSSVRNVLALGGITDVTAKLQSRSKNKLNNARAAIKALQTLL